MIWMFCFISLMVSPHSSHHFVVTLFGILICIYLIFFAWLILCVLNIDEKIILIAIDQISRNPSAMMMIINRSDMDFFVSLKPFFGLWLIIANIPKNANFVFVFCTDICCFWTKNIKMVSNVFFFATDLSLFFWLILL